MSCKIVADIFFFFWFIKLGLTFHDSHKMSSPFFSTKKEKKTDVSCSCDWCFKCYWNLIIRNKYPSKKMKNFRLNELIRMNVSLRHRNLHWILQNVSMGDNCSARTEAEQAGFCRFCIRQCLFYLTWLKFGLAGSRLLLFQYKNIDIILILHKNTGTCSIISVEPSVGVIPELELCMLGKNFSRYFEIFFLIFPRI